MAEREMARSKHAGVLLFKPGAGTIDNLNH